MRYRVEYQPTGQEPIVVIQTTEIYRAETAMIHAAVRQVKVKRSVVWHSARFFSVGDPTDGSTLAFYQLVEVPE